MPIAICIFSAIQLGFSCAGTAQIFHLKEFAKFPTWRYGVTSWLVCASVADILITGSLVYYLHRGKQNILQATTSVSSLGYSCHFELTFLFDSICEKLVSGNAASHRSSLIRTPVQIKLVIETNGLTAVCAVVRFSGLYIPSGWR